MSITEQLKNWQAEYERGTGKGTFGEWLKEAHPEAIKDFPWNYKARVKLFAAQETGDRLLIPQKENPALHDDVPAGCAVFVNEKADAVYVANGDVLPKSFFMQTPVGTELDVSLTRYHFRDLTCPELDMAYVSSLEPSKEQEPVPYLTVEVYCEETGIRIVTDYTSAADFIARNSDLVYGSNGVSECLEEECVTRIAQELGRSASEVWDERNNYRDQIDAYISRNLNDEHLPVTLVRLGKRLNEEYLQEYELDDEQRDYSFKVLTKLESSYLSQVITLQSKGLPTLQPEDICQLIAHADNFPGFDPARPLRAMTMRQRTADRRIVEALCEKMKKTPENEQIRKDYFIADAKTKIKEVAALSDTCRLAQLQKKAEEILKKSPIDTVYAIANNEALHDLMASCGTEVEHVVGMAADKLIVHDLSANSAPEHGKEQMVPNVVQGYEQTHVISSRRSEAQVR